MLRALHIRDLALIEHAEVQFARGLNVLSGETGGGKSLVVAALKLLRGEKAPSGLVRHGADELRVDGEFELHAGERSAAVAALLRDVCDVDPAGGDLLVTRIVDAAGRSKVRINGRPATLQALKELGAFLLEIHGQGESRALMRPEIQCETLDAFAGTTALRQRFADALRDARATRARLTEIGTGERDRLRRLEFLRFQLAAMEDLALEPGELATLEEEHRVLAHLDSLRERLGDALACLQEDEANATDLLSRGLRALHDAASIDHALLPAANQLAEAEVLLADAVRATQSGLSRLDLDPSRLASVEERLADVRRALDRYGPTETHFFATLDDCRREIGVLDDAQNSPREIEATLQAQVAELTDLGRKLDRARAKAGPRFCAAVEAELAPLGMPHTKLRVATHDDAPAGELLDVATAHGPAPVDFEVRINAGEPFQSLQKTASGGEMARLVLAIKKTLADQDRVPFLVFDEVDAEIGGRLGLEVGRKLRDVATHHQVLIVTHLPQVAAFADAHFQVAKSVVGARTHSTLVHLRAEAVERELAAMSLGEGADAAAIEEARRLVARAKTANEAAN